MPYCEKCKSTNVIEAENGNYCCNCGWDSTKKEYVKKHTNAYKIRAMSDEELAEYLYRMALCSLTTVEIDNKEIAIPKLLKWLQSEAE